MDDYLKPVLPQLFMLIDPRGWDDGPYRADALEQSTEDGAPWVIPTNGTPRFFRLDRQDGDDLHMEGKIFKIKTLVP